MTSSICRYGAILPLFLASCSRSLPPVTHAAEPVSEPIRAKREIRLTGILEAVHSSKILVPQIWSQGGPMTLTKLIPNGSRVKEGDVVAVFDATQQIDQAREAEADLAKAEIELQKGPVLSEIDRQKTGVRLQNARIHVESLKKSSAAHGK